MRKFFCLITTTLILLGCDRSATSGNGNDQQNQERSKTDIAGDTERGQSSSPINPDHLLTLPDAEKILGEPAQLTDSATTIKGDVSIYSCAFIANSKDQKSGKTGAVYFLFERYAADSSARKKYSFIKKANEDHGIKELHDLGDEAYFHSDGENFYFVMVRKGVDVFNMKVNKITSTTSLDEFNRVAKNIAAAL